MIIRLFILTIIVLILFIIKDIFKYLAWNYNFKDGYNEQHSLYLNYNELKDLYNLNPNRWFWELPKRGTKQCPFFVSREYSPELNRLFYDSSDSPSFGQMEIVPPTNWWNIRESRYKDSVSRVFLTYPAYKLALRMQKNKIKTAKEDALTDNKRKFLETCQKDIDNMFEKSQRKIEEVEKETIKIQQQVNESKQKVDKMQEILTECLNQNYDNN